MHNGHIEGEGRSMLVVLAMPFSEDFKFLNMTVVGPCPKIKRTLTYQYDLKHILHLKKNSLWID